MDTNILIYSRDEGSPFFEQVCSALRGLVNNRVHLFINPQVLREYAVVSTKPYPKGLGISVEQSMLEIEEFEKAYEVIPDIADIWETWKKLCIENEITGFAIHDVYIAAAMLGCGISKILTVNTEDFERISEVQVITPMNWEKILTL